MKLGTKAAAYGLAGLVLAGAVIFSGSALGLLGFGSSGVLSILLTDPPSVPTGVTAVYITYSGLAVHAAGFGDSGWVNIPGQGTIDTMRLVNLSRTISSAKIPALTYNLVRFNISKASVDFMGTNYSVSINSGRITVAFVGGLKVNPTKEAAALVDISPTVLNVGNSAPRFTMAAGAHALQVPSDDVGESMKKVGNETSMQGRGWFQSFRSHHSDNLTVSGLILTSNSLVFTALNQGSDPMAIRMVVVTADGHKEKATGAALGSVGNSFVFAVQADGSLKLLSGNAEEVESLFEGPGYSLAGGASFRFSFSGAIVSVVGMHTISSGHGYTVVVVGSDPLSVQTVVAG